MAGTLPRFMVMRFNGSRALCASYGGEVDGVAGSVVGALGLLNVMAKIEVEAAKVDSRYVHLRFSHSNKYWAKDASTRYLVAVSDKPVEDRSDPGCTLFEPTRVNDYFTLTHVQSGERVFYGGTSSGVHVFVGSSGNIGSFTDVDWEGLVKLPEHVAFKGDNGKYLQCVTINGRPYQQFSADDRNATASGYRVFHDDTGAIRVKSDQTNQFWRLSPGWIWADSTQDTGTDINTVFNLVRVFDSSSDEYIIAIFTTVLNRFLKRLTTDGIQNSLNANTYTIVREARIAVEELVLERRVYNVTYLMNYARIYDEEPYLAGTATLSNTSSQPASLTAEITYQEEKSYSFNRSISLTSGVSSTVHAGIPEIIGGSITVSHEISGTLEWGTTTTTITSVRVSTTVSVPPRSSMVVNYVGSKAKCDVPFSYTQRDVSSTTGQVVLTQQVDGIFNGVNCYNFHFEMEDARALALDDLQD